VRLVTRRLVVIPAGRSTSNHAAIARALGIDIIARRFGHGDRLPNDTDLCLRFGVSRPVLREGVKTLAAKGLLSTKARIGTVVREPGAWNMFDPDVLAWHLDVGIDTQFLRDLADIRLAVEPRAAALAATRRTEDDLARLRDCQEEFAALVATGEAAADADLALHQAIAFASGNPFMRSIGAVVEAALRASFLLSAPKDEDDRQRTIRTHARIVAAIAERDPDGAAQAMSDVIRQGLRRHAPLASEERDLLAAVPLGAASADELMPAAAGPPPGRTGKRAPLAREAPRDIP
jgi:DNA-binding FadR family transcriptional regulator